MAPIVKPGKSGRSILRRMPRWAFVITAEEGVRARHASPSGRWAAVRPPAVRRTSRSHSAAALVDAEGTCRSLTPGGVWRSRSAAVPEFTPFCAPPQLRLEARRAEHCCMLLRLLRPSDLPGKSRIMPYVTSDDALADRPLHRCSARTYTIVGIKSAQRSMRRGLCSKSAGT